MAFALGLGIDGNVLHEKRVTVGAKHDEGHGLAVLLEHPHLSLLDERAVVCEHWGGLLAHARHVERIGAPHEGLGPVGVGRVGGTDHGGIDSVSKDTA